MIGRSSAKRPEPTPAGESTGGREIRVRGIAAQARHCIRYIRGCHALCRQPRPHRPQRFTTAMQRLRPSRRIGRIVEQPRLSVTPDESVDQRRRLLRCLGRMSTNPSHQHPPQILGRAGIAPEIMERPAFDEFGSDLAALHLCRPTRGSRSAMVSQIPGVNRNWRYAVTKPSILAQPDRTIDSARTIRADPAPGLAHW
jgi:hypothetical protein